MEQLLPGARFRLRMEFGPITGPHPVHISLQRVLWDNIFKLVASAGKDVSVDEETPNVQTDRVVTTAVILGRAPGLEYDYDPSSYLTRIRRDLTDYWYTTDRDVRQVLRMWFSPID